MPPPEKSRRKPPKKVKPGGLPSPCPTPFYDLRTSEIYIYRKEDYPVSASAVRFLVSDDAFIPELAFDYCLDVLRPITSHIHACVHATSSLLFVVDVCQPDILNRLVQVTSLKMPSTSVEFTVSHGCVEQVLQDCLNAEDMELGLENCFTDFSTPSSSEDERPQPRKQAATRPGKHIMPPLQPTPPYCPSKPAVSKPALPPTVPVPTSSKAAKTTPLPASQPEVSSTAAAAAVPDAAATSSPPASSHRSALSGQPDASQAPVSVATPNNVARRRRHFRFRAVDFSALKVDVPTADPCLTLLIRPASPADGLRELNSQKVARELGTLGEPICVRDIRNGGLAVDFPATTPPAPLLALTTLAGCKVACSLPAADYKLAAVVSGIHPEISEEDILADMRTTPEVKLLSVKRLARPGQQSWSVKITVEGSQLPERALLYGRSRRVAAFHNKPLQCLSCGRFGHTAGVCRSSLRCWTCGEAHDSVTCPKKATPTCPNCGGPHPADAAHCPARQLEVKVCKVKTEHQTSFRTARAAVQRAAKTYAAAARGPAARAPAPHNMPPQLPQQPQPIGGYRPSIAHPHPPPDHQPLVALFKSLLAILTAATTSADLSGALLQIAALFKSHAPTADASDFAV